MSVRERVRSFYNQISRTKDLDHIPKKDVPLKRVLSLLDLSLLGVGASFGVATYVVIGPVTQQFAGPAVLVSLIIAAGTSLLSGLCYCEFAARMPSAGSAYIYSYVSLGEVVAFLIGWTMILEYVIGAAAVARAFTDYVDVITNNATKSPYIVPHIEAWGDIDFRAFIFVLLFSVLLSFNVKISAVFSNTLTCLNLLVTAIIVIAGATKANVKNWSNFAPYGFSGIITGAALNFYNFIGYDVIATTGEEAIDPGKTIPMSVMFSLGICLTSYIAFSTVLTLMVPYNELGGNAAAVSAFIKVGMPFGKYIITVGALASISVCVLAFLYPIPRVLYAMATDGLLFKPMAWVNPTTGVPLISLWLAGSATGIMAAFFSVIQLVEMNSIGTLLAYTVVSSAVVFLRYPNLPSTEADSASKYGVISGRVDLVTKSTSNRVRPSWCLLLLVWMAVVAILTWKNFRIYWIVSTISVIILLMLGICILCFIHRKNQAVENIYFKVPYVPFFPGLAVLLNLYLLAALSWQTWVRCIIWMIVGLCIYFLYGIRHSKERVSAYQNIDDLFYHEQHRLISKDKSIKD